ncbi:unnamed protein product [Linum tenue]|uniref:FAR1 domain-containing protein n=1 Tax=Linum tenue TaxID=586396 RepID=A0AAV0Q5H2_9ROSI|nr:unnamed protein product [Linum tenue]
MPSHEKHTDEYVNITQTFDQAILALVFETLEDAEFFYNAYAKRVGFSIRKRDCQKSRDGEMLMQRWVCAKEGHRHQVWLDKSDRKRKPRRITRGGCEAEFRVNLDHDTWKWVVKKLISTHNHNLVSSKQVHLL